MPCRVAEGDIGRRFKKARLSVRPVAPKQTWVAQQLGVSSARLSNWERGEHDPPEDFVTKAAALFGLDEKFFYTERDVSNIAPVLGSPQYPVGFPKSRVPYAGVVPAGDWGDPLGTDEFIELDVKYEDRLHFAAKVVGTSCYPALKQGDITIWRHDPNPSYGLIVLATRVEDNGCTVKEFEYDQQQQRSVLVPINPTTDPPADGDGWSATARLVGVIRIVDGLEQTWFLLSGIRKSHLLR